MSDIIYALASGAGRSGVAVVRLSGVGVCDVLSHMGISDVLEPRRAYLRTLYKPNTTEVLDSALVLYFNAPHSFTGEDVVELHLHGSRAILNAVFQVFEKMDNVRLAQAGEFSKRAFSNNKMDLTEAEGLIDLINAETEAQMKQAQRQASGQLKNLYNGWADSLVPLLAHYEAYIDFPDEDLPESLKKECEHTIDSILDSMEKHLSDNNRGERIRDGIQVAIIGEPNAGKSSLVNSLANRDVAIVSDTAGTTRDVIEVALDINGYPVRLFDTAGLRNSTDSIEQQGMIRAMKTANDSDIVILMVDGTSVSVDSAYIEKICAEIENKQIPKIILINKSDKINFKEHISGENIFCLSVEQGSQIDAFIDHLKGLILGLFSENSDAVITRTRHREALMECSGFLQRAKNAPVSELVAEDLRMAVRSIGKITGQIDVEDLLDIVFRDFCIGK